MIGLVKVKLLLRSANGQAASNDTCTESGLLSWLVSYPDLKRRSTFAWTVFRNLVLFVAAISWENFLLNVHNRTIHDFHFTCLTGDVIFSNTQHYAINTCTWTTGSCMPSCHQTDAPLMKSIMLHAHSFTHLDNNQLRTTSKPF